MFKESHLSPMLDAFFANGPSVAERDSKSRPLLTPKAPVAQIASRPDRVLDAQNGEPSPAPRQLSNTVWQKLSDGVQQRAAAVEAFLTDVLSRSELPPFLVRRPIAAGVCAAATRVLNGIHPPASAWSQLFSTDVFVDASGDLLVLDENFSCPIGLEKLSQLEFSAAGTSQTQSWLKQIVSTMEAGQDSAQTVVMDSGSFSPAFRENCFLARTMNISLVSNRDLQVTPAGLVADTDGSPRLITSLLRRVDDDLLDPNSFRPDSLVGVPGLIRACRQGLVQMVNMPGTGLLRNRAVSMLIPEMIRYYLNETPKLPSVTTLLCGDLQNRDLVLGDLNHYAVRTIDVGHPARPFFGTTATEMQKADITARLLRDPSHYVARPIAQRPETAPATGPHGAGFNLRVFGGPQTSMQHGIGRTPQPDGGATVAIISDPSAFFVGSSCAERAAG